MHVDILGYTEMDISQWTARPFVEVEELPCYITLYLLNSNTSSRTYI